MKKKSHTIPNGYEINPKTGKLRKSCLANQIRNEKTGRCRLKSNTKSPKKSPKKKSPIIPNGYEINPANGKPRKSCLPNQVRNEKTGRCRLKSNTKSPKKSPNKSDNKKVPNKSTKKSTNNSGKFRFRVKDKVIYKNKVGTIMSRFLRNVVRNVEMKYYEVKFDNSSRKLDINENKLTPFRNNSPTPKKNSPTPKKKSPILSSPRSSPILYYTPKMKSPIIKPKSNTKILNDNVINFFSKKKDYRSLSNFWTCDVVIHYYDQVFVYESGEHCFHGEKYRRIGNLCTDKDRKQKLLEHASKFIKPSHKTAEDAKKMGGKRVFLLTNDELKLWSSISIDVQKEICNWKFNNYEEVRTDLKKSGTKILVHPALRSSEDKIKNMLWEGKAVVKNGKIEILGANLLGKIWMELRCLD